LEILAQQKALPNLILEGLFYEPQYSAVSGEGEN
jgi:hypothetical protein